VFVKDTGKMTQLSKRCSTHNWRTGRYNTQR